MNEIKDLILPIAFDKGKAIKELHEYLLAQATDEMNIVDILGQYAKDYVEEVDKIENKAIVYNSEFWEEVKALNQKILSGINWKFYITDEIMWFECIKKIDSSPDFNFNELDLINKQYRLLQEIYYLRQTNKQD